MKPTMQKPSKRLTDSELEVMSKSTSPNLHSLRLAAIELRERRAFDATSPSPPPTAARGEGEVQITYPEPQLVRLDERGDFLMSAILTTLEAIHAALREGGRAR